MTDNERKGQVVGGAEGACDSEGGGGAGQELGGNVSRDVLRDVTVDDEASSDALLRLALVEVARQRCFVCVCVCVCVCMCMCVYVYVHVCLYFVLRASCVCAANSRP